MHPATMKASIQCLRLQCAQRKSISLAPCPSWWRAPAHLQPPCWNLPLSPPIARRSSGVRIACHLKSHRRSLHHIVVHPASRLREEAASQLHAGARYARLEGDSQELDLEAATWLLLYHLYGVPDRAFPGGLGGPAAAGCGAARTYQQKAADLLAQDDVLNRYQSDTSAQWCFFVCCCVCVLVYLLVYTRS